MGHHLKLMKLRIHLKKKKNDIIRFLQLILVAFIVLSGCLSPQEEGASYIEDLKARLLR